MRMKKTAIVSLFFLSFLSFSCVYDGWNQGITGNGNVKEEIRNLSGFTGVHVSSGIDVYLSQDEDFKVGVVADENLMDVIETEVRGRMLEVGTERYGIRRAESKKVYVTLPELNELKISSAGDLHAFDLVCEEVKVNVSSAGDARIHATEEISMDVSSAGNIYYMGDARVIHSRSSSAGDIIKKD